MLLDHLRHLRYADDSAGVPLHRRVWNQIVMVALCADTTTVRILLANASLLWAIASIADPDAFERPGFALMALMAPQWVWATAFVLHFAGVYWRVFDPKSRPAWALLVNGYGFLLWFASTAAINVAVGGFTPGSSLEWTMCGASAWALYRTGLNREIVTP